LRPKLSPPSQPHLSRFHPRSGRPLPPASPA